MQNSKHFKRIVVITVLFALVSGTAFAQTESSSSDISFSDYGPSFPHNEIYLGYGYPQSACTYLIYSLAGLGVITASAGQATMDISGIGSFNVGYNWNFFDWMSLGGLITGEFYNVTYTGTQSNQVTGKDSMFTGTAQVKITFQYGGKWVRGYHGLSAGLMLMGGSGMEITPTIAFNVTVAGIKIGPEGPGFSGFADLCLGTSSLINAGVIYSF